MQNWRKPLLVCVLFLAFCSSLIFVIQETKKEESDYFWLAWILFFAISGYLAGVYLKHNSYNDFLKILLPTSVSVLGTVWLLSTGYLNLRAENLKRDISSLRIKDSLLKVTLANFKTDSINLKNENDNLSKLNKIFNDSVKNMRNTERRLTVLIRDFSKTKTTILNKKGPTVIFVDGTAFENFEKSNYSLSFLVYDKNLKLVDNELIALTIGEDMDVANYESNSGKFIVPQMSRLDHRIFKDLEVKIYKRPFDLINSRINSIEPNEKFKIIYAPGEYKVILQKEYF